MKVRDIMTTPVRSIVDDHTVGEAARLMAEHRVSGLPVVNADGRLVGVISETDLLHRAELGTESPQKWWLALFGDSDKTARAYAKAHGRLVRDVMSSPAITIDSEADIEQVARLLDKRGIKRVPVVSGGALEGVVTRGDLARLLAQAPATVPIADTDSQRLQARIQQRMRQQSWLDHHLVYLSAESGRVSMRGYIPTADQRKALKALVRETEGVVDVEDELLVGRPTLSAV